MEESRSSLRLPRLSQQKSGDRGRTRPPLNTPPPWNVQCVVLAIPVAVGAYNAISPGLPAPSARRLAWNVSTSDRSDGFRVLPSAGRCKVDHMRMRIQCLPVILPRREGRWSEQSRGARSVSLLESNWKVCFPISHIFGSRC